MTNFWVGLEVPEYTRSSARTSCDV